jgi:surfactin synthase thioesterase subunit
MLRQRFGVFSAHHRMLAGYRPDSSLRVPAIILSARDSPNAPAADLWRNVLSGPVTTAVVDGDHYAFLRPPLVSGAAASILELHGGPR